MHPLLAGAGHRLLSAVSHAALLHSMLAQPAKRGKRTPLEEADTGPEAASKFLMRRNVSGAHSSSIRKLQRADRIKRGVAKLKYGVSMARERYADEKVELEEARSQVAMGKPRSAFAGRRFQLGPNRYARA